MEPAAAETFAAPRPTPSAEALKQVARELEATFLSVMLREAGAGAPRGTMGGGIGEEQFASFLTETYARKMADTGGIGLAEIIFRSLARQAHE